MKKKIFHSMLNYDHHKQPRSVITEPSMTKPDLALTIPEILNRFTSGRKVDVPIFDDFTGDDPSHTGVDIRTMDISEVHELLKVTRENAQRLQHEANLRHYQKQQEEYEKKVIEKYEQRRQEKNEPEIPPNKFIQLEIPGTGKNPENGA